MKKPPPLVPSSLIASWRGDRAAGDASACRPARVCTVVDPWKFWIDAADDEHDRDDERQRQQDAQRSRAIRSTQKLPSGRCRDRDEARG